MLAVAANAQTSPVTASNVLAALPPDRVVHAKAGSTAEAKVGFALRSGYHVNSNTPTEDYIIPLKLTWNPSPLGAATVVYPQPRMERYSFSKIPLSVYTGDFTIVTRFAVPANAPPGPVTLNGRVRYQACNDRMCLAPKNLDFKVQAEIVR